MDTNRQRQKGRDGVLLSLNMAIGTLNFAKGVSGVPLVTVVLGSVGTLLTMIRVRFLSSQLDVRSSRKSRIR